MSKPKISNLLYRWNIGIVREHPISLRYMDVNDGYSVLLRAMQSSVKKLQIKSAFLLSSLCNKEDTNNLKLTLVNMGLVEQATGLLAIEDLVPEIRYSTLPFRFVSLA